MSRVECVCVCVVYSKKEGWTNLFSPPAVTCSQAIGRNAPLNGLSPEAVSLELDSILFKTEFKLGTENVCQ